MPTAISPAHVCGKSIKHDASVSFKRYGCDATNPRFTIKPPGLRPTHLMVTDGGRCDISLHRHDQCSENNEIIINVQSDLRASVRTTFFTTASKATNWYLKQVCSVPILIALKSKLISTINVRFPFTPMKNDSLIQDDPSSPNYLNCISPVL